MAKFVECTLRAPLESKIFVNLDEVVAIREDGEGSVIIYAGDDESYLRVKEQAAHILAFEI